jgi:hypothetical protein
MAVCLSFGKRLCSFKRKEGRNGMNALVGTNIGFLVAYLDGVKQVHHYKVVLKTTLKRL